MAAIKIILSYMLGYVKIAIEGYYIERFINICTNNGIIIWNIKRERGRSKIIFKCKDK